MGRVFQLLFISVALLNVGQLAAENVRSKPAQGSADPQDWSMYNYDVVGSRHNGSPSQLSPKSVAKLKQKWRFPTEGSKRRVGAIHATPRW